MANSSPPMRAIVSLSRTSARRRSATWHSSLSPTGCPRVSLTVLKKSRSSSWQAIRSPRLARVKACSSRSLRRARLGRPVSVSCLAMCTILASERSCSVMSWWVATVPPPDMGCAVTEMQRPSSSRLMYCADCLPSMGAVDRPLDIVRGVSGDLAVADVMLKDLGQRHARPQLVLATGRTSRHSAGCRSTSTLVRVEHDEALHDVVEGGIELQVAAS